MAGTIDFYFDIASPFAYLAFYVLRTSPVFTDVQITYKPVLLSGILKACKNTPLLLVKNKAQWAPREHARWVQLFNIPMNTAWPPGYPPNSSQTQRALLAVERLAEPEKLAGCAAGLFHRHFAEARAVNKPEDWREVLERILGGEVAARVEEMSRTDEMQRLLRERTEAAVEGEGSFGLPWYVVTNVKGEKEAFFGFDHIGQVANHLGLRKPEAGSLGEGGWKAML
ncbi:MAG: hypothetical protein OHK93_001489 [Ramalina farinacea]|uniref:Glutathione S-transferase kappa n=1 Tax=Ramalina farinacea TaxID=258253 RepID=A0AA43TWA3_9LECA|nr:hypothetical protein [Ramalina farinacea]